MVRMLTEDQADICNQKSDRFLIKGWLVPIPAAADVRILGSKVGARLQGQAGTPPATSCSRCSAAECCLWPCAGPGAATVLPASYRLTL